jgi:hypothetical protein
MIKLYKVFTVFLLLLFTVNTGFSQGKDLPVNLSLIYPVSINQSLQDNVNFNVGILGSRFKNLNGLGVNGLFSILENDLNGIQVNGLYAETSNKLKGIQLTGGVNAVEEGGSGAMIGGIANLSFNNFEGLQLAGITNLGLENVKGVQVAGLYNIAGKDLNIMQISLAGNIVGGFMSGAQLSAFFNLAANTNRGIQLSAFNMTKDQNGAQIGIINIGQNNSGLQLGILNMTAKKQSGLSLGLFYINDDTKVQLMMSGGNLSYGTFGVRFETNNIYSMLDAGAPVAISSSVKSVMFDYRVGYSFDLKFLNINTDLGFTHISNESNQTTGKTSKNQFGLTLRLGLEKNIYKRLGLFVNTGYLRLADSYSSPVFTNKVIFEGGIVVL